MSTQAPERLALRNICKSFPGVRANHEIGFSVRPGEIHALLGENGAGKSTLVKMIYGVMQPNSGEMAFDGKVVQITSPAMARGLGIGMVFQHFSLFDALTVLENIALGMDSSIPHAALRKQVGAVLGQYGLALDPDRIVATLSVGERQRIEIVRALLLSPKLLIMDEPTSVLVPQEVTQLFDTLRVLAAEGCSILYISHKLEEIRELCETATILRAGEKVASCDPRRSSAGEMAEAMLGSDLAGVSPVASGGRGEVRFRATGLTMAASAHYPVALSNISLSIHAGEVFGIAGVAGNGQGELLAALAGERRCDDAHAITVDGVKAGQAGIMERRDCGLCIVPEERNGHGAVPEFSLGDNCILTARRRLGLARFGIVEAQKAREYAGTIISQFDVRTTGPTAQASALSGGNLQKFLIGREILQDPGILIVAQPTWGADAGAAIAIRQALIDLAARGSAVLVISQDLDELLSICHRLAVINGGHLSEPLEVGAVSVEQLGLLMGGVAHTGGQGQEQQGQGAGHGTDTESHHIHTA